MQPRQLFVVTLDALSLPESRRAGSIQPPVER
jgi:hypothetical protein